MITELTEIYNSLGLVAFIIIVLCTFIFIVYKDGQTTNNHLFKIQENLTETINKNTEAISSVKEVINKCRR